jgi:(heptosyl)LPS beta-1,4-glucosyltransferase
MPKLSLAIIVQNEEADLPRWLAAVRPVADEIVAVDSGSTDRTVEILEEAGARVVHRDWTGYADQRNYLADLCTGDWILMLDADEVIGPRFREALQEFKAAPEHQCNGYRLAARIWFFGHWLRFGGFYPEWNLRLYRKGAGRWVGQEVHERVDVDGPVGRMYVGYTHYSYDSVADYRARSARYALAAGQRMLAEGRRDGRLSGALHAAWTFAYRYLIRMGFLDGKTGWWAAWLEAGYTYDKYARLADLRRGRGA